VERAWLKNAKLNIYLDVSLPPDTPKLHNFPHQLLMRLPVPLLIKKMEIHNLDVSYEEYHKKIERSGIVYFNNINGQLSNITNMPEQIRRNGQAQIKASAILMHQIPVTTQFLFDLRKTRTGAFAVDFNAPAFDARIFNPVSEPLGLFRIKRGKVNKVKAHMEGDNSTGKGKVLFLYQDLHLTPLKIDANKDSGFRKKSIFSFLANTLVIKNENPSDNNEPRTGEGTFKRDPQGSFFNLIWKTVLLGILKTTGIPEKKAYK
jgi:hypothetical protein